VKTITLFSFLFCICIYPQSNTPTKTFNLYADSNSYLIYSSEDELLYEFTPITVKNRII